MQDILSVELMRDSDSATIKSGVPGKELMWRAALGIYNCVNEKVGWKSPVAIICGSGNNAGDGYALALILKEKAIESHIYLTSDRFSEDGKYYYDKCVTEKISASKTEAGVSFESYPIILDCIYGTGFHGEVKEPVKTIIDSINSAKEKGAYVVSVDINSGLNGNNGMADCCVKSSLTVSVGSFQPGHFLNMAKDVMEAKENCPIGINPIDTPYELWEASDAKKCFPLRKNMSNKGTYGYITLIGGSLKYSGAIRLASLAETAMRCGAGVTTVAIPKRLVDIVAPSLLESTVYPLCDNDGELVFCENDFKELIKNRKAIAFGMGIGISNEVSKALVWLLNNYEGVLIVDADGLTCLASIEEYVIKNSKAKLVLTPHIKEFSRLCGKTIQEIQQNPIEEARAYALKKGVTLLLKGPSTIVTDGTRIIIVSSGCPGMATAGSGDVLSGITAAVCGANTENVLEAVASAALINGIAGEKAQENKSAVSMIAGDTVKAIYELQI